MPQEGTAGSRSGALCCRHQPSPPTAPAAPLPREDVLGAHAAGSDITLQHTESTSKAGTLLAENLWSNSGGVTGLAEMEVGWCPEHRDLSPALLSGNEGLQALQLSGHVYRVLGFVVIS